MAIASPDALLRMLRESTLLDPAQLDQLAGPRSGDARALADELVGRGWLTPFQAEQLVKGRAADLVLGPYVLLEAVGKGHVGIVYRACHRRLGHEVAVKVIQKDLRGDLHVLQRFRREVEALTRLSHPNVVRPCDVEEVGTAHYYAMEFVSGGSLDEGLEQCGAFPVAAACDFARQVALALQHAHEQGLIHRDIKPGNMLLALPKDAASDDAGLPAAERSGHWGTIKLLDLGLARLEGPSNDALGGFNLTQPGFMLGTADYMAPEQVQRPHDADIRADIYGLGCTLYHLLTGQPPFPGGELIDKLNRHRTSEATPIEELRPEVPPELAGVVRKMMAKKPEARYQTPTEVADVLATILAGLDVKLLAPEWRLPRLAAGTAPPPRPTQPTIQAEPTESLLPLMVVVVLCVGSVVGFWLLFGP